MEAKICPVCQKICPTNEFVAYGHHEDCTLDIGTLAARPGTIGTFRPSSMIESKGDKKREGQRRRRQHRSEE